MAPKSAQKPLYRADVAERLVRLLRRISGVLVGTAITDRPTFYAGDKVFAFVNRDGVGPFVMKGRPKMKEWVVIPTPRRTPPGRRYERGPMSREAKP